MKTIKIFTVLLFAMSFCLDAFPQRTEISGYILPKVKVGQDSYFTFFVRAEIDTTKSLLENFELLSADTLERVAVSNEYQSTDAGRVAIVEIGDVDVIAARFVVGDWVLFDHFDETNVFVPFRLHVNGKNIISGYDSHSIKSIKNVRPISLPTQ